MGTFLLSSAGDEKGPFVVFGFCSGPVKPTLMDENLPQILRGASSSSRIGWLRKISRDLRQRPRISFSVSCTFFPGREPLTERENKNVLKETDEVPLTDVRRTERILTWRHKTKCNTGMLKQNGQLTPPTSQMLSNSVSGSVKAPYQGTLQSLRGRAASMTTTQPGRKPLAKKRPWKTSLTSISRFSPEKQTHFLLLLMLHKLQTHH